MCARVVKHLLPVIPRRDAQGHPYRFTPARFRTGSASLVLIISGLLAGCASETSDEGRCRVSGTVTRGAKPLARGSVMFHPATSVGQGVGAVVQDGHFEIPASQGLVPGEYVVEVITSSDNADSSPSAVTIDPITGAETSNSPASRAEVRSAIRGLTSAKPPRRDHKQTVRVKAEGPNTFQLDFRE